MLNNYFYIEILYLLKCGIEIQTCLFSNFLLYMGIIKGNLSKIQVYGGYSVDILLQLFQGGAHKLSFLIRILGDSVVGGLKLRNSARQYEMISLNSLNTAGNQVYTQLFWILGTSM